MVWKVFVCLSVFLVTAAFAQNDCPQIDRLKKGYIDKNVQLECRLNPCDPDSVIVTKQAGCPSHCKFYNGGCYLKVADKVNEESSQKGDDDISGRFFNFGNQGQGSLLPGYNPFSICPKSFPENCNFTHYGPHLYSILEPPVDIPYCQRIPCSTSNPSLDSNRLACHSQPGCFFDVELDAYRRTFGHSILPGVPVCHLAIRNEKFLKLAHKYVYKSGKPFNGIYTNCLIQQNHDEIFDPHPGCYMVDVLRYIGVHPKRAGWSGITPKECSLIGGCYKPGMECCYPAQLDHVKVRSGKDEQPTVPTGRSIYGQPRCLPFNHHSAPADFLNSYHHCLQSGCVLDSSIGTYRIQRELYNITMRQVPSHLQQQYWSLVLKNVISADNWLYYLNKLKSEYRPVNPFYPQSNNHQENELSLLAYSLEVNGIRPRSFSASEQSNNHQAPAAKHLLFPNIDSFWSGNSRFPGNGVPHGTLGLSYPNPSTNFGYSNPLFPGQPGIPFLSLPQCPYHNYKIRSYAALTGRLDGCCERNLCYIPRSYVGTQYSGIAPYFANWEHWGECSVSCGGGSRSRKRRCVAYGDESCGAESEYEQVEVCNSDGCPYFEDWSQWGSCSATCGAGTQTRTRECKPYGNGCSGSALDSRACSAELCPTISQWSDYSSCNVQCGKGQKTRTRTCVDNGRQGCDNVNLYEDAQCETFCGQPVLIDTSACLSYTGCMVTKKYSCLYNDQPGHCYNFQPTRKERCYKGICAFGFFG